MSISPYLVAYYRSYTGLSRLFQANRGDTSSLRYEYLRYPNIDGPS